MSGRSLGLTLLLLLGACFSPTFPQGLGCSPNAECPPEQRCEVRTFQCRVPLSVNLGSGLARPNQADLLYSNVAPGKSIERTTGYSILASLGTFRLLWSDAGEYRGSLYANPQMLRQVDPGCQPQGPGQPPACPPQDDLVEIYYGLDDPDRIDFTARSSADKFSGLDLQVADSAIGLVFDLLVNGARVPSKVTFISPDTTPPYDKVSAPAMPCGLSVQDVP